MVRTSDGSFGTVPDPDPVDPGGDDTTSTGGFGDELGGDPAGGGGTDTDDDGFDDDDPSDAPSARGGGGGVDADDPRDAPSARGGGGSVDPEPDPPSVDELRSEIGGAVDGVRDTVSDASEGVRETVDDVRDVGVDDVRDAASDVGDRVREVDVSDARDAAAGVADTVADVTGAPARGDAGTPQRAPTPADFDSDAGGPGVGGAGGGGGAPLPAPTVGAMAVGDQTDAETLRERVDTDVRGVDAPEPDREITDDLTRGGLLSERPGSADGLLPGEVGGVDVSEERLRDDAAEVDAGFQDAFGSNPELTVAGSDLPDRAITGGATAASGILNVPGLIVGAETATEVATNAPGEVREEGAGDVAATAAGVGAAVAGATADRAEENPARFAGGAVFNVAAGAGAGRALGTAGRGLGDRVRTAGGTRVDPGDLASDDVVRFVETDGAEGERFPGADDPGLFRDDPATAVAEQAERNTPAEVDNVFGEAGVDDGATLTKALDTEPEGPARGRADQGFRSAPDETADDFDFETPGSFFGPELSPNFLRTGGGEASLSPVPGLPDFGNRPTAVMARTDVENPDADTLDEFNEEMIDRSGETTARPKPADEVNPGEIEAVVPPGAEFAPVGSGGLRGVGRRLGIGSDLFTEVDGRRVPIRTVAPADEIGDAADDASGAAGRVDGPDGETGSLSSFVERPSDPVDRPVPVAGGGPSPFGSARDADPDTSTPGVGGSDPVSSLGARGPSGAGGASSGSGGSPSGSGGPFGTSGTPPASDGGPSGGSPTSSPGGTSSPTEPAPTPFGSVSVGSPTSEAPTSAPAEPVSDPTVGLPGTPSQPRRRRRDDGDEPTEPNRQRRTRDERAPLTTPFANPIAGFGGLFGR